MHMHVCMAYAYVYEHTGDETLVVAGRVGRAACQQIGKETEHSAQHPASASRAGLVCAVALVVGRRKLSTGERGGV